MTNPNKTLIVAVLDRSGSMYSQVDDTIGGFNAFIEDQKGQPGEAVVTLTQFDTFYEVVYENKPIAEVPSLALEPRGGTALYDALGRTISTVGANLAALEEDDRPGTVLVLILTDGYENSSHEYTAKQIKKLIKQQTEKYNWTFTYIGANQDAITVGASIGIPAASSLTYDPNNVAMAFAGVSSNTSILRGGGTYGYTDEQRKASGV